MNKDKAVVVPRFVLPSDAIHPKCDKCGYRLQQLAAGWGCQHCGHGQTGCYWRGEKRRMHHEWGVDGENQICRLCGLREIQNTVPSGLARLDAAKCIYIRESYLVTIWSLLGREQFGPCATIRELSVNRLLLISKHVNDFRDFFCVSPKPLEPLEPCSNGLRIIANLLHKGSDDLCL